jgi:hypothetical protein
MWGGGGRVEGHERVVFFIFKGMQSEPWSAQ